MSPEHIRLERQDAVATLTFNRPEIYNAMDEPMIRGLRDATHSLAADPTLRVLIIAGAGKAFIAGGDVAMFYKRRETLAAEIRPMIETLHEAIIALRDAPFPVVAKIHGAVAGAGVSLALACDFSIAADNAVFTTAYAKIGQSPDGGSTYFLPRIVGMKKAAELIMLTEPVKAAEALALGLVNKVVAADALDAEVAAFAARLASGPTQAYARAKRLMNQTFDSALGVQLAREADFFVECAATADFKEGVTAFVEKRAPRFSGQ
ncbi:MAG TPA: enoyl-CoA hydratase [Usitatibacteraceae bacterium]|nr:enoyl-CoA hydratase [Usitatibacteraceae bacterium]